MIEWLEVWIPHEPVPSVRGLDTQPIRPLLEVTLPGYIIGYSRGLATIQHEKSDLPPGETIQSGMQ